MGSSNSEQWPNMIMKALSVFFLIIGFTSAFDKQVPSEKVWETYRHKCPDNNVDFEGFTLDTLTDIDNWNQCGQICAETHLCSFWTWGSSTNECFLKTSDRGITYSLDRISGDRDCH